MRTASRLDVAKLINVALLILNSWSFLRKDRLYLVFDQIKGQLKSQDRSLDRLEVKCKCGDVSSR